MKKLLSLLSVLTISGTAIPTTIAASPYQKEENNLENLIIRNKRQNNENKITGITKIVITTNGGVISSGVVLNNKVYFGSRDNSVYEYDPATGQQKIVINTNGDVVSSGVVLNNKVYFGSVDGNVYEYNPLELIESDIINLQEQIRIGSYIYYKKQNINSNIKNISSINLDNLNYIETKAIKTLSKQQQKILLPFHNYHEEKLNTSEKEIIYNSPDDEISEEITKSIEIQKGLSITQGKSETTTKTTGNTGSFGITVGVEAEAKFFGSGFRLSGEIRTDYSFSNESSYFTEITLENSFNSSNIRKEEKKELVKKQLNLNKFQLPLIKNLFIMALCIYKRQIYILLS
ncbi:hypothetical protein [Spiroplasma endosymbiont of Seladonia tumulorum]|uniref:hypothetical protein n=1 Tax=Spiroplasma endosymbiont of Seladonia tumulorum TaxID=3066321 RepID=UPI0030CC308B